MEGEDGGFVARKGEGEAAGGQVDVEVNGVPIAGCLWVGEGGMEGGRGGTGGEV